MTKQIVAAAALSLASLASAQPAAQPAMQTAVDYAHAGITVAMPEGFVPQELTGPFEVARAHAMEDGKAVVAITLSAFPADDKVTAEEFADSKLADLKNDLAVRYLALLKKTPMPVAGVTGTVRLVTYTYRGAATAAAQIVFLRASKAGEPRVCYLLTVESASSHQKRMLQVFGAVTKTAAMTALRHPGVAAAAQRPARAVKNAALGAAIQCPDTWYSAVSAIGTEAGQTDFLLGGEPMPSVRLFVTSPPAGAINSEACSRHYLGMVRLAAKQQEQACTVVSEAAATLGKLAAHEFVVRQGPATGSAPAAGAAEAGVVIVQRTAFAVEPDGETKAYVLVLTVREADIKAASQLMATIADSFERIAPTTQPTQPAATQPAGGAETKPAPGATQPAK